MDKIKKLLAVAAVSPLALFAEGQTVTIDTSAATNALTSIKDALTTWVTGAMPILVAVAGAFLVFWLVKFAIRIVKKFGSSAH